MPVAMIAVSGQSGAALAEVAASTAGPGRTIDVNPRDAGARTAKAWVAAAAALADGATVLRQAERRWAPERPCRAEVSRATRIWTT